MKIQFFVSALASASLIGCVPSGDETQESTSGKANLQPIATAPIADEYGEDVGLASIVEANGSVALNVSLSSMPSGEKALHLHTAGACDGPSFKSAGGHLNPQSVTHGKLSKTGPHFGDFPNITIAEDGLAEFSFPIAGSSEAALSHIFDEDGTAVMVHSGPDDYTSDPAGAAGPRIACGVLSRL
ncbi:MAG: superoxide dismutase family protein [Marinomonas sp.]